MKSNKKFISERKKKWEEKSSDREFTRQTKILIKCYMRMQGEHLNKKNGVPLNSSSPFPPKVYKNKVYWR